MKVEDITKIINKNMPILRCACQIQSWEIEVIYEPLVEVIATCECNVPYNIATITIDPEQHKAECAVLNTLRHECLHIVISEFDYLYNKMISIIPMTKNTRELLDESYIRAQEVTVGNIERMLDYGLGLSDKKFYKRGSQITNRYVQGHLRGNK